MNVAGDDQSVKVPNTSGQLGRIGSNLYVGWKMMIAGHWIIGNKFDYVNNNTCRCCKARLSLAVV